MDCKHCGMPIPEGSRVCPGCGQTVPVVIGSQEASPGITPEETIQTPEDGTEMPFRSEAEVDDHIEMRKKERLFASLSATTVATIIVVIILVTAGPVGYYYGVYNKDSDDDGVPDREDEFPKDKTESKDTDGDGHGDNKDVFPHDPREWSDQDGDGTGDNGDAFPADPAEWVDTDGDGFGDNGDAFPQDASEWSDRDGDLWGDNSDVFPDDPEEWADTDGDGTGDNGDAFPKDPGEWNDTDGDGVGDNTDLFPSDPEEWEDADGDGIGDNGDPDVDNDGAPDVDDPFPLRNAMVRLCLLEITVLDQVDFDSLYGDIWMDIAVNGLYFGEVPEGDTYRIEVNIPLQLDLEIIIDIRDDLVESRFEFLVYELDPLFDDHLDLCPRSTDDRTLIFTYDLVTGQISGDVSTGYADGSDDGTQDTDDDDCRLLFTMETVFEE